MTKPEFQTAYGAHWAQIVAHPSFFSAMQLCSAERLKEIENLSAAEIEVHGRVHLASFQGHLKTEAILLSLAIESQEGGFDIPTADYGVPDQMEIEPHESTIFPEFAPRPPKPKAIRKKNK